MAKHCSGFSLWPTKAHGYNIGNSPYKDGKGDIVKEFVESCRKYGIKPGIYASTTANGYLHVANPGFVQSGGPVSQEEYNRIVTMQLTELWSNYGKLFEIWFDGGVLSREEGGADVLSLVQKLQPDAIAFQGPFGHPNLIRWVGNEEGTAPYPCWATAEATTRSDGVKRIEGLHGDPDAPYWCPGEADFPLRRSSYLGGWFWKAGEDNELYSLDELMEKYITSVGRNTNMLVGLVVDNHGLIPDADVRRAAEFGREIRKSFGRAYRSTSFEGNVSEMEFNSPQVLRYAVIKEDIRYGERVMSYVLSGKCAGEWVKISEGSCIGHKRIEVLDDSRKWEGVRLEITSCKAEPVISDFSVYR